MLFLVIYCVLASFIQDKHDVLVSKLNRQVTSLQEEVNTLKAEALQQKQYIRQLEQVNDDLERSNRNALASVEDIEDRLNQVLEKNALLEVELYEKEELNVRVQRLKDEVRGEVAIFLIGVSLFCGKYQSSNEFVLNKLHYW